MYGTLSISSFSFYDFWHFFTSKMYHSVPPLTKQFALLRASIFMTKRHERSKKKNAKWDLKILFSSAFSFLSDTYRHYLEIKECENILPIIRNNNNSSEKKHWERERKEPTLQIFSCVIFLSQQPYLARMRLKALRIFKKRGIEADRDRMRRN